MDHSEQIQTLIAQAKALANGDTKVSLLEQAVKLADLHQDADLGFQSREELITAAAFSGKAHLTLIHFPWMVAMSKKDPNRFPPSKLHWKYKWLMASLPEFPSIPKATVLATLAEMREEFKKANYKDRTTWEYARIVHMEMGDRKEAAEAQSQFLASEPATDWDRWFYNANCQACETNNQVSYYLEIGDIDTAIELAEVLFSGKEKCANVPKVTYANVLLPLLKKGDVERSAELFKLGFSKVKHQRNYITAQSKILAFLSLTGNEPLAAKWYEAHAAFAEESYVPVEKLDYLRAAYLFWKVLAEKHEDSWFPRLPQNHPLSSQPLAQRRPSALAEDARRRAEELSHAFDVRNENTYVSGETKAYWEMEQFAQPITLPKMRL